MALMETLGVASIMPFVSVLATPQVVETNSYLASIYEYLGYTDEKHFLFFLGVVVLTVFITALIFKALTHYAIARFSFMRLHSISCRLLGAYMRQPYELFLTRNTADLGKAVLSEVQQVTSNVLLPLLKVLSGSLVAAAILLFLLAVEPVLSLAVGVILGGSYLFIYLIARNVLKNIGRDRLHANQQRFVLANEALSGIKELRILGREEAYLDRFRDASERFARHHATNQLIGVLPQFGIQAVAFGGILVLVLYLLGRYGGLEGALPVIAVYAFAGYRLMPAFQEVFKNLAQLRFSLPALDALCEDLSRKEDNALRGKTEQGESERLFSGSIRLRNLSYRYPGGERPSIQSLSLEIPAGTSAAFVGSTGAGKSTLVDIILGLLEPVEGEIHIGEKILKGSNIRAWQRNVGYVPQSIYLVDDTVTANIAFGVPEEFVEVAAVQRAARTAHIHEFIVNQLPKGYDTIVGERGIRLSGGQRQRLAIARALYHDPGVVVLDEATNALDSATEAAVMEAIEELHGRKTVILIAHRLSTVRNCDRIYLLEYGSLQSEGTYAELMSYSEPFRSLVRAAGE